jgi:hypothetical protein
MESKKVCKIKKRKDTPPNCKLIGKCWVDKLKDNGTFLAHTVAKSYDQVLGKYVQESHAPVVNDTTFCTTLILKSYWSWNRNSLTSKLHFSMEILMKKSGWNSQSDTSTTWKKYMRKSPRLRNGVWNSERPLWSNSSSQTVMEEIQGGHGKSRI